MLKKKVKVVKKEEILGSLDEKERGVMGNPVDTFTGSVYSR